MLTLSLNIFLPKVCTTYVDIKPKHFICLRCVQLVLTLSLNIIYLPTVCTTCIEVLCGAQTVWKIKGLSFNTECISFRTAAGFSEKLFNHTEAYKQYCNGVLGGWDYSLTDHKAVMLKHRSILREFYVS